MTGLERTDNGMKLSTWPDVPPINQKNYYTYALYAPCAPLEALAHGWIAIS